MRVISWNVNGGQARAIEWLEGQPWDVAVLLEVRRPCWRLLDQPSWGREGTSDAAKGAGHHLSVAILHRPGLELVGLVPPPPFTAKEGRYEHRAFAVQLRHRDGELWTVLG